MILVDYCIQVHIHEIEEKRQYETLLINRDLV